MGLTAVDLGLRGAVSGVFLLIIIVALLRRATDQHTLLGMAMSAGGVFYAITTAPYFPKAFWWWVLPILSAQPAVFWLWARAAFDDDFVLKRWHGAVWLAMVAFGFALTLGWANWPALAGAGGRVLSLVTLGLAVAAAVQTVKTWRVDLVARRRRLRLAMLAINVGLIAVVAGAGFAAIPVVVPGGAGSFPTALCLFVVAMLAGVGTFGMPTAVTANDATAAIAPGDISPQARRADRATTGGVAVDPLLLRRLDHVMTVERVYRQEGLAIGALAARFDVPEYRLRQAINEGLGYRNFNAFLNRYRIEDAKTALSDPAQREVPVLTIAMDAGFQSIGPFNRAFKAETGMTPSEFRRDALVQTAPGSARDQEIGQWRRDIG
ncbi:AraC family transcriptional regulator [Bradyrhizobium sp. CCBAU 53351]|uniref:AraC family transcriptional regulator n=1 Tax=Bradyrhizobium sp. CCBAU 53351 TaxID=1325114 RepID=UPI001889266F|nr:helix-turn-helix domain-containing protein [Bradyrhizobium sp. CCBAU 53351]QOZ80230.1 AraC family transcriptional regulator [Bradyrhizobium sp. CCBAU 53351]